MGMFDSRNKKSGDSARQDETKAREEDQKTDKTPEQRAEALPELVEGAIDRAKEKGAPDSRIEFLEAQLVKLTKVIEGLQGQVNATGKLDGRKPEELLPKYTRCPTCSQYTRVCGGKHRPARVLPQLSENMEGFPGVRMNGVTYFGMSLVPVSMYESIMCTVANYETMKRRSRFDLGKIRGWDKEVQMAQGLSAQMEAISGQG